MALHTFLIRYSFRLKISSRVPGLWLVVLLQYTHVIHTCMSVLNCPMLPGFDGITKPVSFTECMQAPGLAVLTLTRLISYYQVFSQNNQSSICNKKKKKIPVKNFPLLVNELIFFVPPALVHQWQY